jgi:glycosyltransferase involved in cell wall biosynthesis
MLALLSSEASTPPDVSVVVPVWGDYAGERLREALASLTNQDLAARIIVVDNASEPPVAPANGVELIRSPTRLTVGAARNLGLAEVTSPYVLFWDADDVMLPGTLRFLRERIAEIPDAVLVAASILEGDPPLPHRWPRRWTYPLTRFRRAWALGHCVWSLFPTTGCALMSADAARAGGYADANSGEDWVLGVSLAFRGRILLVPRPGRLYRRHAGSLWETQRSPRQLVRHAKAVRARIRNDPEVPSSARALLPAIALLQLLAVLVVRPLAEAVRAIRPTRRSARPTAE